MNYFLDFEFIEGFHKPISWLPPVGFNKPRHSIEIISIGIYADDGSRYYAISSEFNPSRANDWVKRHVIAGLPPAVFVDVEPCPLNGWKFVDTPNPLYKTVAEIRSDVINFIGLDPRPVFYGYFADYDWVAFCTMFGTMMDLPERFPMYCRDLKQMMDETVERLIDKRSDRLKRDGNCQLCGCAGDWDGLKYDSIFELELKKLKANAYYPKQEAGDEHNAIQDAIFNARLFNFIRMINTALK